MVSVPFDSSDTSTKVTCSGQDGSTTRRWDARKSRVERGSMIVEVSRFGAQHVLAIRLSCAFLTEKT